MFDFTVSSSSKSYSVRGPVAALSATRPGDVLVVDPNVAPQLQALSSHKLPVVICPEGEDQKTLGGVEEVIKSCQAVGLKRGGRMIAVGGGLTQDLVTAAANLYMRGVPWVLIPTTWLSIMDSCIGGKSSLNVGAVKNLAGNFNPPDEIWIDLTLTRSLPDSARAGGLAEGIKIAYCSGPDQLDEFVALWEKWRVSGRDADAYALVGFVLRCKAGFVERDEFDRGERLMLNLGHTFAHALEAATEFRVGHGQAVALGVLAAAQLTTNPPQQVLLDGCERLAREFPACHPGGVNWPHFDQALQSDKKHSTEHLRLIVPSGDSPGIIEFARSDASMDQIRECMRYALERCYSAS